MQKVCKICGESFLIAEQDIEFYKKINVPSPTLCPDDRLKRRMRWRNDNNLYHRKCDATGKNIISMFKPNTGLKVYSKDFWWSDSWDALEYGKPFDFTRPFFAQFQELNQAVPQLNLIVLNDYNSDYTNYTSGNKNCYLCFAGNNSMDCFYSYNAEKSRDCADCYFVYDSELCFELIHSEGCYNTNYSLNCKNCVDSWFLEDCFSCHDCFMCFNLQNRQYYILNKPYSREEYFKKIKNFSLNTNEGTEKAKKIWTEKRLKYPKRENHNINAENCTGEYISNSKNCHECYLMSKECEDCKFILNGFPGLKDSYDCTYSGGNGSLMYECMGSGIDEYMILFGNLCLNGSSYLQYCNVTMNCKNCFGCSNLKNKSYCILNKQYTREEYETLLPRIIEHMKKTEEYGKFFPSEISPFDYKESQAEQYFPIV